MEEGWDDRKDPLDPVVEHLDLVQTGCDGHDAVGMASQIHTLHCSHSDAAVLGVEEEALLRPTILGFGGRGA